ncbi:MAG: trigger factor [Rhodospirillaceae bacterium]|jgi:trigger factor|nr:trigger factor [Rhodospirillaceae bacterium]MBT5564113.1 trigger factor [Rhodospirillaceae bacterium]MBT6089909.1 trigger factor [Rhodospirillaceae bacterium]MBT6960389.1 trigger factor [Rhodospirillaceae bacterium]MBT7451701.1 trigger factor [Rhodospirillaceae bacterium]
MQITEKSSEGLKRELNVTIGAQEIEGKITDRLTEVGKQVRLPGFRPGKVPMNLLRKRFGESVRGEVVETAIQESTQKAIEEKELKPAVQPKIDLVSFEAGEDLEFSIAVELLPEIEITDLSSFKVEKLVATAGESQIDETVTKMAENNKKSAPLKDNRPAAMADVVVIDFIGSVDGEEFEGGKADDFQLELGSGRFIPGFEEQVVGMEIDGKKDVEVSFPDDYHSTDLAGKPALFKVTLKGIEALETPPIDEDFAKTMGFDDLAALKDAVRGQIEQDYVYLSRMKTKRELLDHLSDSHTFEVPPAMLDAEFDTIWQQVEQAKEANQLDPDDEGKSDDELRADYRKIAERRVRLGLLLSDVGQKNNLTVAPEELSQAIGKEASRFPGQEQAVVSYYQNNPQAIEQVRAPLFEDKVIDFLLELAQVTEKTVTPEELVELTGATETDGPVPNAN